MSDSFGTYAFLSWLRRGVSTGIVRKDGDSRATTAGDFARAAIAIEVAVSGAPAGSAVEVTGLVLAGPGEVAGFDPRVVARTWPKPDVYDVEDNFFPLIEFDQPDLPWRYTPASPKDDRLRPWFCLIALKDGEYTPETVGMDGSDRPLPVINIDPTTPLPKLSQAWAWAHVQVSGDKTPDNARMKKHLTDEPQRVVARLLCPRRLEPKTAYTVFVVPTFERGRLAGLGKQKADQELSKRPMGQREWKGVDALEISWADNEADASKTKLRGREIELPVYYSWRFQTGLGGDFEYLVSLLQKKEMPGTVGKRDMDVQSPGAGLPKASESPLGLEGVLKAPKVTSTWGESDLDKKARDIWTARLTELLNGPVAMLTKNTTVHVLTGALAFQQFIYRKRTALPQADDTFTFALADWDHDGIPDLIAIKKSKTASNSTEVQILSGASGFQESIFQTSTPLPETDDTFAFALADWDGDGRPDLIAIQKRKTGSNSTEVHILSGASRFQQFIFQSSTALPETDDTFAFALADWDGDGKPDLVAIKQRKTASNSTEVQILSGASRFQQSILQIGTALHETDDTWTFSMADWDGDGRPDLIAVKKSKTGSNSTEVHILSGASGFRQFIFQIGTALHETDDTWAFALADWNGDGRPDLIAIQERDTATPGVARRVALPLYGRWHAARDTIAPHDPHAAPPWFPDLNIDPRLRVAAGLGTYVVQTQQQQLMASAWRQVEGIRKINAELRQAQLAREVAVRAYERHIAVNDDESVLNMTAPVQGRVLHTDSATGEKKTVKAWLADSPIAEGIFEAQWRRVARPLGPLGRRQGRAGMRRKSDLLDRLNQGDLSPAKPPATPSRMSTFAGAGLNIGRLDTIDQDRLFPGQPFPGPAIPLPQEYTPDDDPEKRTYSFDPPPEHIIRGSAISWVTFGQAATELFTQLKKVPAPAQNRHKVEIAELKATLVKELDPRLTIESSYKNRLRETKPGATWHQGNDPLGQVMAAPEFPQPMFEPLRDLSQDWLLPGLDKVPPNTMSLLKTNERFVEAYMVGLNHEMARELLWNDYPTDQRGSYFRQFWDPSDRLETNGTLPAPGSLPDIKELYTWTAALGENFNSNSPNSGQKLVLLIRGELLRRYPKARLYATKAKWIDDQHHEKGRDILTDAQGNIALTSERHPVFSGTLKPDVSFFKFDLTEDQAKGDSDAAKNEPGYFFVLQEKPSETRFGMNAANKNNTGREITKWDDLSWGHLAGKTVAEEADVASAMNSINYIDLDLEDPQGKPRPAPSTSFENPEMLEWRATATLGSHAADIARITLQGPVRVAVHAWDMLPE